jgi:hypothetical protein
MSNSISFVLHREKLRVVTDLQLAALRYVFKVQVAFSLSEPPVYFLEDKNDGALKSF